MSNKECPMSNKGGTNGVTTHCCLSAYCPAGPGTPGLRQFEPPDSGFRLLISSILFFSLAQGHAPSSALPGGEE